MLFFCSCSKSVFCGVYNTKHSKDKSMFLQIKINKDSTAERREFHTGINDIAKGKWLMQNKYIILFFDISSSNFPADTVVTKIVGKKMYFVKKEIINKEMYLKLNY